jgi:tetratricopeptide (TPR) repeat protein
MRSVVSVLAACFLLIGLAFAQQSQPDQPSQSQPNQNQSPQNPSPQDQSQNPASQSPAPRNQPPQNQPPPRSDSSSDQKAEQEKSRERSAEAGESSSRDTQIDTSAPKDDAKNHPNGGAGLTDNDAEAGGDVQEMHPWNPFRAVKDDEVGDFYFKQKDYKGALARYQDALIYKPNDAVANFRMAQVYEKMGQPQDAIPHYQEYLRILPKGPLSKDAKKALAKLGAAEVPAPEKAPSK